MRYSGEEPRLEDMLKDPIVRMLMTRDAVAEQGLRRVLAEASDRFRFADVPTVMAVPAAMLPRCCGAQSGMPSR